MVTLSHIARDLLAAAVCAALATPLAVASGGGGGGSHAHDLPAATTTRDTDFEKAEQAIKAKQWQQAITLLRQVVARDAHNADAYNYLGYAERNLGNLEAAFQHYANALALDPKHLGVREYLGETYLLSGNLAKAEEQLAALDTLCGRRCEEYRELSASIGDYKRQHAVPDAPG